MSNVTQLLSAVREGNQSAAEQLLPLVYDELRRLAARKLSQEKPGQTLQATALVHEAYVRLVDAENNQAFRGRRYFFAAAAEAMRRILVEKARRKQSVRAGGHLQRQEFSEEDMELSEPAEDLLALDEALQRFAAKDHRKAKLIELRYFGGLTMAEAASVLEISVATAERDWSYAKAWLKRELTADGNQA
jgi:RNA polymerase sigma factor (TIGR02999 family)